MMRVLMTALVSAVLAAQPVAVAEGATPTALSVSIHDSSSEVRSGDQLEYTATVRNDGTDDVNGRLVITVPAYVRVTVAEGADRDGADASWTVSVPAGGTVTKNVTAVLGDIPKGELRVTTLVALYLGDETQPTIRSAEADAIAGVKDTAHAANDPVGDSLAPSPIVLVATGLGAVLVIALLSAWIVWRRARSARRP